MAFKHKPKESQGLLHLLLSEDRLDILYPTCFNWRLFDNYLYLLFTINQFKSKIVPENMSVRHNSSVNICLEVPRSCC